LYEAFTRAFPDESWGPWELLPPDEKDGWRSIARELAEAREQLAAVRELATQTVNSTGGRNTAVAVRLARKMLDVVGDKPEGVPTG
jgi:hypothetical protein